VVWLSPGFRVYRRRFMELSIGLLGQEHVDLVVAHAHAPVTTQQEGELSDTAPSRQLHALRAHPGRSEVIVSTAPPGWFAADLLVLPESIGYPTSWGMLIARRIAGRRVAVFGHGADFSRPGRSGLTERLSRWRMRHVDWWFAYNEVSRDAVVARGMPASRVTPVQNTLDLDELVAARARLTAHDLDSIRDDLALGEGPVGLFIGALHGDKRLPELIAATDHIHRAIPEFSLVVVGDGPARAEVRDAAATRPWVRVRPGDTSAVRARYWAVADVATYPAWAGLAVNEALAMGVPPVIGSAWPHPPEASYVVDGENGVVVAGPHDMVEWAHAVVGLLRDRSRLDALRAGALLTGAELSIDAMARRFVAGVLDALVAPRR
jgi:glycosyltransferase involved in cell wall biosynthesis